MPALTKYIYRMENFILIGFIIGLFLGAFIGVTTMCLCNVASNADKDMEEHINNENKK